MPKISSYPPAGSKPVKTDQFLANRAGNTVLMDHFEYIEAQTAAFWASNDAVIPEGVLAIDTTKKLAKLGDGTTLYSALPWLNTVLLTRTAASWTSLNPVLISGQMGYESDTGLYKIGDGSTAWTSLQYGNASISRTAASWTSLNPVLKSGQFGYETDTHLCKVGDGSTAWTSLEYHHAVLISKTAAAWTSANTVLKAGQVGYETDSHLFKVGDGSTAWTSLEYHHTVMFTKTAAAWTSANPTLKTGQVGYESDTGLRKVGDGSTAWTSLQYSDASISRTAASWTSLNPVLKAGQFGIESDTKKLKVGDGSTAWTSLSYWLTYSKQLYSLAADVSTGTVAADTGLQIIGAANETWTFMAYIKTSSDNAAGMRLVLSLPAGATIEGCVADLSNAAPPSSFRANMMPNTGGNTVAFTTYVGEGVGRVFGTVIFGAGGGTFKVQVLGISPTTAAKALKGSYSVAHKI